MRVRRDADQAERLGQQLVERLAAAGPAAEALALRRSSCVGELAELGFPVADAVDVQGGGGQSALGGGAEQGANLIESGRAEALGGGAAGPGAGGGGVGVVLQGLDTGKPPGSGGGWAGPCGSSRWLQDTIIGPGVEGRKGARRRGGGCVRLRIS